MEKNTRVRIFVTLPIGLVQKIDQNVKAKPNDLNGKLNKCVEIGYKQLTNQTQYEATTQPPAEVRRKNTV